MSETPTLTFGEEPAGLSVDLDRLVSGRLLVQANSGGGKSWLMRSILEQTHGKLQHLVLDPEGEFATLRERFPYVLAGKGGDVAAHPDTAAVLCRRLMELGASAVIDLYDLRVQERKRFVRLFLEELMSLPQEQWRALLVVLDEAHVYCPERGHGEAESSDAVATLASQGRKRGYALVAAVQRLSRLSKDVAAELQNKLIGRTGLDVDVKRAADDLGLSAADRAQLRKLSPGEFFAVGPAVSTEVVMVRAGQVLTTHPQAGRVGKAAPPPPPAALAAALQSLADLPAQASEERSTVDQLRARVRELEARTMEPVVRVERVLPPEMESVLEERLPQMIEAGKLVYDCGLDLRHLLAGFRLDLGIRLNGEMRATASEAPAEAPAEPEEDEEAEVELNFSGAFSGAQVSDYALGLVRTLARHHPVRLKVPQLATLAGRGTKSSALRLALSELREAELVSGDGLLSMTAAGWDLLGQTPSTAGANTAAKLQRAWLEALPREGHRKMLRVLLDEHPNEVKRDDLFKAAGYSATSSLPRELLADLREQGLVAGSGWIGLTDLLFP